VLIMPVAEVQRVVEITTGVQTKLNHLTIGSPSIDLKIRDESLITTAECCPSQASR